MTAPAADQANEQAEAECLDAIDMVELYCDDPLGTLLLYDVGAVDRHLVAALMRYITLLEATNSIIRGQGGDVGEVRRAARETAKMWRTRTAT